MNRIIEFIFTILYIPVLIIMAIIYILEPDDEQAIIQGIGKGYTLEDLERFKDK